MGSWASCDFSAIAGLSKRMHELADPAAIDSFFTGCLDNMVEGTLKAVKEKTPVQSGELRRSWQRSKAQKWRGVYQADLFNNKEYAPFVENGHRQEVGRYVPAIGKQLVKPWVEGQHMLRDSVAEAHEAASVYLERKQREFLSRLEGK